MHDETSSARAVAARPRVLLVTPIPPATTGNGLAMRASVLVDGLARVAELVVAVVPVADPTADEERLAWASARCGRALLVRLPGAQDAVRGWLADRPGRALAQRVEPLPARARLASPGLGAEVLRRAGGRFDAIVVQRSYLAGLVAGPLDRADGTALVLDLDEDDEVTLESIAALQAARGARAEAARTREEAHAFGRLLGASLPSFDAILVASELERRSALERRSLSGLHVLPNAVEVPERAPRGPGRPARVLFVGNLEYAPNRDALERLVGRILPAIRRHLPDAELHLVGAGAGRSSRAADGVIVHGRLDDLGEAYERAALTVVPLAAGGGSRLKVLEAFAMRVPVVGTREAAAGLDVTSGREFLIGTDEQDLAVQALAVLRDPELAGALTREALAYVTEHHERGRVAGSLAEALRPILRVRPA